MQNAKIKPAKFNLAEALRTDTAVTMSDEDGEAPRLRRENALNTVRAAIVEGRLPSGQRLTERELCAALSASRTIVREIVRQLEGERLIDVVAHRGLRVASLTPKLIKEIYDVREELEVLVVRAYIRLAAQDDLQQLQELFGELEQLADTDDFGTAIASMTRFMNHLVKVADHEVAADLLDHLLARINRARIVALRAPGRIRTSLEDLRALLAAIIARDPDAAAAAVRVYVDSARADALASWPAPGTGSSAGD